jgi:Co/Zn/Cd efflux system component
VWEYNPGHLWFLQALFIFAVIYVVYRLIFYKDPTASRWHVYLDRFPPDRVLVVCIAALAVLTFVVRMLAPVGEWFFGLQLAHFSHYIFCFFAGILFYRGEWFSKLQRSQAKRWGIVALVTIPMFFVLVVLGGALEGDEQLAKFMGGPYWQSMALAVWESILLFAISIFLLYFFRERVNMRTPFLAVLAGSVYTVYIIHQTIVAWLDTWFIPLDLHMFVKFACVSLISIPLCFALAYLILKIPGVKRVVG